MEVFEAIRTVLAVRQFHHLEQVNALLAIPDEIDVLAIIPFGYPVQRLGKGNKKRKALGEIAHREKWGNPFA